MTSTLSAHRDRLETLAQAVADETLDEFDAYAAAQTPPRTHGAAVIVIHPGAAGESLASARYAAEADAGAPE